MQIPKELLNEKNYEGTRLIEVNHDKIKELQGILKELQLEAKPFLEEMEKISPKMDPIYTELGEIERKKKGLHDKLAPHRAEYDVPLKEVEKIDQRAQLVKDKIQPLVMKIVEKEVSEFEQARQLVEKDGKLFVEVADMLEEKIKEIRAKKK